MKFRPLQIICVLVLAATWIACGAGHPRITNITVTPATGSAPISPRTDVQYTATATFSDGSHRELTIADGLTWSSSIPSIATINDNGSATCLAVGQAAITAKAPVELNITVNNGINNVSPNATGTAQLSCTP